MNKGDSPLLEEYKTLREEIMRTQRDRQVVLGFAITGVGTILGLIFKDFQKEHNGGSLVREPSWYGFALISIALLVLIGSLLLTRQHTLTIERISSYIRNFIEPNVDGLNWETRWTRYRMSAETKIRFVPFLRRSFLPMGFSKALTLFYCFLVIGIYVMTFLIGLHHRTGAFVFVTALFFMCLALCNDLYFHISKSWKIDWNSMQQKGETRT